MKVFGLSITRQKTASLAPVDNRGGLWGIIRESFTGAWQKNIEVSTDTAVTNPTLFRCLSLISSDISKMRIRYVVEDSNNIWSEVEHPEISPLLRNPNQFQNRIQFFESWMLSKLAHGNTYILKRRSTAGKIVSLYILDPNRVKVLISTDGSVYYQLQRDDLAGQSADSVTVPASEIIHDRWNTIFHPMVGLSPITAGGLAALQGLQIQKSSAKFFGNGSMPGGILSAPGAIDEENAKRLKDFWENNYTGNNAGKIAVLGDNLKYESLAMNALDSQLIEQLRWSAETICSVMGVPPHKVGVGQAPSFNNVEALDQQYYSQCVQIHIEGIELCLDGGFDCEVGEGTEFDLSDLFRMDSATLIKTEADAVKAGIKSPNESRRVLNLPPVAGGATPYLQQQNYSLAALDKRDQLDDPFAKQTTASPIEPLPEPEDETDKLIAAFTTKAAEVFS
ncbi:phage portal protein [Ochrobactrum chromiisoli]|uniref:Phage portal protein n=1 Tax=Ochrobactrum chromiisoli TaxID=2993941 RepID=A0ABT3QKN4_9HYPH|nr:phage portal protein [Ochrobactrum chromiisoli]MCX2696178.1 phage portal protein [Ochrobactrum chromiisoli]